MATACSIVMANNPSMGPIGSVTGFRGHAATSCILMTVSVVSICALVVCGVLIVREYSLASTFFPAVCRLSNVTYTGQEIQCRDCASGGIGDKPGRHEKGKDACVHTQFPCVRVMVTYAAKNGTEDGSRLAILYENSVQASGQYSQCSYSACKKRRDDNIQEVRVFAESWRHRLAEHFDCYYDTTDEARVIVKKTYAKSDVIHSMLWPSVVIVTCGLVFLRLKSRRHNLTLCGRRPTSADEIIDLVKKGAAAIGGGVSAATAARNDRGVGGTDDETANASLNPKRFDHSVEPYHQNQQTAGSLLSPDNCSGDFRPAISVSGSDGGDSSSSSSTEDRKNLERSRPKAGTSSLSLDGQTTAMSHMMLMRPRRFIGVDEDQLGLFDAGQSTMAEGREMIVPATATALRLNGLSSCSLSALEGLASGGQSPCMVVDFATGITPPTSFAAAPPGATARATCSKLT